MTPTPAARRGPLHRLTLQAEQVLLLGTGRGSGYSTATATAIPAATLLGALAASYQRLGEPNGPTADVLAGVSASDAGTGDALAMDRYVCKYRAEGCPDSRPWWQAGVICPGCGNKPDRSKGDVAGQRRVAATRVALDERGRAKPDMLFAREGWDPQGNQLSCHLLGDPGALAVTAGTKLRVGGARSVTGLVTVTQVTAVTPPTLTAQYLRVVLTSRAVFVDDFGVPTDRPTPAMIRAAFGTSGRVLRAFTRWGTAGGWARLPGRPKPEDPAVLPASAFHIELDTPATVATVGTHLGIRATEGCGWYHASHLPPADVTGSETGGIS